MTKNTSGILEFIGQANESKKLNSYDMNLFIIEKNLSFDEIFEFFKIIQENGIEIVEDTERCIDDLFEFKLPANEDNKDEAEAKVYERQKLDDNHITIMRELYSGRLKTLSPGEASIVSFYFGLDDGYQKTLEEVCEKFNVTSEQVSRIESKISRTFCNSQKRSRKLKDFID